MSKVLAQRAKPFDFNSGALLQRDCDCGNGKNTGCSGCKDDLKLKSLTAVRDKTAVFSNPITEPVASAESRCGPDVTKWLVGQFAAAKNEPDALKAKQRMNKARMSGAAIGFDLDHVAGGAAKALVLKEEIKAGFPKRTPDAESQMTQESVIYSGASVFSAGSKEGKSMYANLLAASLWWKGKVATGGNWDFKSNKLKAPSVGGCQKNCVMAQPSITMSGTSYGNDVPANLFFGHLGRFLGFSLNTLQLGSQYANLLPDSAGDWDTPDDTVAVAAGFDLPSIVDKSALGAMLDRKRSALNVYPCKACSEAFNG